MPYKIQEAESGTGYEVINLDTSEVKARHDSKAEAEAQVELLNRLEKEYKDGD